MCKIYNPVGSLTTIKSHLIQNGINSFSSINELLTFQKNYPTSRDQVLSNQKFLLTEERNNLSAEVLELEDAITNLTSELQRKHQSEIEILRQQINKIAEAEKTFIQEFTYSFKALFNMIRVNYIQLSSKSIITRATRQQVGILAEKRKRLEYLVSHFEEAVTERSKFELHDLDRKKKAIDEINTFIYGAIGEQKVVKELEQLPDDYILINDFSYTFDRPLYHKQQRTKINTIQIDHLLISPAGVFLIETKNWSKESVQSLNLRSPVAQIQRTSFALFILLNRTADFKLIPHHWGERKIPIKNLIVLINNKPPVEFQYVKVLTLNELLNYIRHFEPNLSKEGAQEIAEYLIRIGNSTKVHTFSGYPQF